MIKKIIMKIKKWEKLNNFFNHIRDWFHYFPEDLSVSSFGQSILAIFIANGLMSSFNNGIIGVIAYIIISYTLCFVYLMIIKTYGYWKFLKFDN